MSLNLFYITIVALLLSLTNCQRWLSTNSKYVLIDTAAPQSFDSAQSYCMDHFGTNLAHIPSELDNAEAYNLCESQGKAGIYGCRIGLYQPDTAVSDIGTATSSWSWIGGSSFDYWAPNWGINEPQGGTTENCAALWCPDGAPCSQWVDFSCDVYAEWYTLCDYPTSNFIKYSDNNQYILINQPNPVNFDDANQFCFDTFDTSLASMHSEYDELEIIDICSTYSLDFNGCWIGLMDKTTEGMYEWKDGTEYDYPITMWSAGEPTGETSDCGLIIPSTELFADAKCTETLYTTFICNINAQCVDEGQIKYINWYSLQNEENNTAQIPYSNLSVSMNKNTLELTFDIDLEYIGDSSDGHFDLDYNLGTTYVADFDSFGTHGNDINKPGNCQNRVSASFDGINFDEMWSYSQYPYLTGQLSTDSYLSYPPPSEHWTLSIGDNTCTPIHYNGVFSWNELTQCTDYDGNTLIEIEDDGTSLILSGTLYVNVVSPYSMTDTGYYRSFPLIQQDFEISILKQTNVLSSTDVKLFITSIIGIYEDETDESFEMSVLTESADYIQLINPQILNTPLGSVASISSVTTSCLVSSAYTCGQIFTITINQTEIPCPPADFSGIYYMLFDVECRVEDEGICNAFIDDNNGASIALEVESNFIDNTCEAKMYDIIFGGNMKFYDDEEFLIEHTTESDDYVIGQNTIYVQVEINFPDDGSGDNYDIFDIEIENVFVCTANVTSNLTINLNQQNGVGGCLSSSVDGDAPYNIIWNGVTDSFYDTQIIEYLEASNVVRFSFLTFDIGRTKMYVHAQLTLVLQDGLRRRLLLQSTKEDASSDQIRHFIDSTTIIDGIIDQETNVLTTKYIDGDQNNNNYDGASNKLMKSIKILFIFVSSVILYIVL